MQSIRHVKTHFDSLLEACEEIVRRGVRSYLELPDTDDETTINFGYTVPLGAPEAIKELMKWWVWEIDRLLDYVNGDDTKNGQVLFSFLLAKRGLTYDEFELFLDGGTTEEDFDKHRMFYFLQMIDGFQRRAFIHRLQAGGKSSDETYFDLLVSTQIPPSAFFFKRRLPLYFPIPVLKKHTYIVSQSGAGKSELMKLMFYDLQRKSGKKRQHSLVLLDPHGDFAWECLGFVLNRKAQRDRVVYINPTIAKRINGCKDVYSPVINIFDLPNREEETIDAFSQEITNAISEMIRKGGDDVLSVNMDAFLKPCIATLLRRGNADLSDLKRFMDEQNNADLIQLGKQSPDPEHRTFFQGGFTNKRYKQTKDAVFIKLQSLLNSPVFRRLVIGKSTLNLEHALNSGKVIIVDFPKGRGRQSAADFGRLLLAYIQAVALRRQDQPKPFRKQTFAFIDEFHNYVGGSVKEIMAESRKFGLSLVLAHQVVGQEMSSSLTDIILSNANLKIAGRNAAKSLEKMGTNMNVPIADLKKIPKYEFFIHNKDSLKPAILMKVPDFLVQRRNRPNRFYMSEDEKQELLWYFVRKSGIYRKIDPPTAPVPDPPLASRRTLVPFEPTPSDASNAPITPALDL